MLLGSQGQNSPSKRSVAFIVKPDLVSVESDDVVQDPSWQRSKVMASTSCKSQVVFEQSGQLVDRYCLGDDEDNFKQSDGFLSNHSIGEQTDESAEKSSAVALSEEQESAKVAQIAGSLLFCVEVNEGMLSTFFFSWCLQRGLSFSLVGQAMGFLSIGILCMGPMASSMIITFGPHRVQYYASWAFVVVRSCYVVLPIIPVAAIYPTMCALYFCMGLVSALSESAASAWTLTSVAPDKRTKAMGILMGTRSAAGTIAPALGGTLYGLGGFYLPIIAGTLIFAAMLIWKREMILAQARTSDTVETKGGSILKSKRVCVCQFIRVITCLSFSTCVIFFQPYLQFYYGFPSWKYGIMVSCLTPTFIVGALVAARMERAFGTKITLFAGYLLISFGLLLFGPSPYLKFLPAPGPSCVWLPCSALALLFCGFSQTVSITSPMILNYAVRDGWSENDAAAQNGMLTIVIGGCTMGFGASCGGNLAETIGIAATASLFAVALPTLNVIALALLSFWDTERASRPCANASALLREACSEDS